MKKIVENCEKLDDFNNKVQKLYKDNSDFLLNQNDNKSIELWNKYAKDYFDSLTEEFA